MGPQKIGRFLYVTRVIKSADFIAGFCRLSVIALRLRGCTDAGGVTFEVKAVHCEQVGLEMSFVRHSLTSDGKTLQTDGEVTENDHRAISVLVFGTASCVETAQRPNNKVRLVEPGH